MIAESRTAKNTMRGNGNGAKPTPTKQGKRRINGGQPTQTDGNLFVIGGRLKTDQRMSKNDAK